MIRRHHSVSGATTDSGGSNQNGYSPQGRSPWKIFESLLPTYNGNTTPPATRRSSTGVTTEVTAKARPKTSESNDTIVCNCVCCATVVSHRSKTSKYKCMVCHTTNLMGRGLLSSYRENSETSEGNGGTQLKGNSPRGRIKSISYRQVRDIVDRSLTQASDISDKTTKKTTHGVFKPLSDYLFEAFSSQQCLNGSFKMNKASQHLHYSKFNLNRKEIRALFSLLCELPTMRPLYYALSGASESLRRVNITVDSPNEFMWLLVLLEIPFLSHSLNSSEVKSMTDTVEIKTLSYDILKRCLGLMANWGPTVNNNYIISWFALFEKGEFINKIDLLNLYITFGLKRYFYIANNSELMRRKSVSGASQSPHRSRDEYFDSMRLKEELSSFEEEAGLSSQSRLASSSNMTSNRNNVYSSFPARNKSKKKRESKIRVYQYGDDWHLKSASVVLSAFWRANGIRKDKHPVHIFYNSLVDFVNLKLDFDSWQSVKKVAKDFESGSDIPGVETVLDYIHGGDNNFTSATYFFCSYPFLVTLGSKISVLEYEAKKQMERKAEEAFFSSLDKRVAIDVYLKVRVRREYIVQDSLRAIQANQQNLKKSLRVQFVNEPGIDAGGLKKEWFLLLTKALFSPQTGMLHNVEDSNYLWFNVVPTDHMASYYLFGVVLGLAIYNSTILDLKFPLALYKLLLGKDPSFGDFQEIFSSSATNLLKLKTLTSSELQSLDLRFEITFKDVFGRAHTRELIKNGSKRLVTVENRDQYIDSYGSFYMRDGIMRQVGTFIKGFTTVAGGNGLSLFSPEEIQLLLCGSEESNLDTDTLRAVTKYAGWGSREDAESSPVVTWFWEIIRDSPYAYHKKFLAFVTGSDRVPATGLQSLLFKISRAGNDSNKLPLAHTCFNELALFEYNSKEKLASKLKLAVNESAGFGIK